MKRKKLIALIVSAVLLVGLMAGCGGSSAPASESGSSAPAADSGSSSGSAPASGGSSAPAASGKTQLNVAADLFSQPNIHDLNASWFVMRIGVSECLVKDGDDGSLQPWRAGRWGKIILATSAFVYIPVCLMLVFAI